MSMQKWEEKILSPKMIARKPSSGRHDALESKCLNALTVPACPDRSIINGIFYQNSIIDNDPIFSVFFFSFHFFHRHFSLWPRLWLNDYVRKIEQANARRTHACAAHISLHFNLFSYSVSLNSIIVERRKNGAKGKRARSL